MLLLYRLNMFQAFYSCKSLIRADYFSLSFNFPLAMACGILTPRKFTQTCIKVYILPSSLENGAVARILARAFMHLSGLNKNGGRKTCHKKKCLQASTDVQSGGANQRYAH